MLAEALGLPLIYVRDKPKDHGMKNRIEGIPANADLGGLEGLVVEDLVSTRGIPASAVQGVRDANGVANHLGCIFSYDLDKPTEAFGTLTPPCAVHPLPTYSVLIDVAKQTGYISAADAALLEE